MTDKITKMEDQLRLLKEQKGQGMEELSIPGITLDNHVWILEKRISEERSTSELNNAINGLCDTIMKGFK